MKFTIAINIDFSLVAQMNAVGHICLGMSVLAGMPAICPRAFVDIDGQDVATMTDHSLILMSARREEHLREAHQQAMDQGLVCNAFFDCMRTGEPQAQHDAIRAASVKDLSYVAVGFFGSPIELKPITRRFSLYREPATVTSLASYAASNNPQSGIKIEP